MLNNLIYQSATIVIVPQPAAEKCHKFWYSVLYFIDDVSESVTTPSINSYNHNFTDIGSQ